MKNGRGHLEIFLEWRKYSGGIQDNSVSLVVETYKNLFATYSLLTNICPLRNAARNTRLVSMRLTRYDRN